MVRVASLKDMVHAKYKKRDIAGMTATEQLSAINKQARELVNIQYSTFSRSLMPLLRKEGIYLLDAHEDLNEEQARFCGSLFYGKCISGTHPDGGGCIASVPADPQ